MNIMHVHLMLNHAPAFLLALGLAALLWSAFRDDPPARRLALVLFIAAAGASLAASLTGGGAMSHAASLPGVPASLLAAHAGWAKTALFFTVLLGALAWFELRRAESPWAGVLEPSVTLLGVLALTVTVQAARLGGLARHPEAQDGWKAEAVSRVGPLQNDM